MNPKSSIKILYDENVIRLNKTFAKMVENPLSDEYTLLQKIRQDYPTYKIRIREIKKKPNKECYKGLTYDYMKDYIKSHEPKETCKKALDEFDELVLVSKCHSRCRRYPTVKKWFLEKYPQIAAFGVNLEDANEDDTQENGEAAAD